LLVKKNEIIVGLIFAIKSKKENNERQWQPPT